MIDHFNLPVTSLERSCDFYRHILLPLGYRLIKRDGNAVGFGVDCWRFGLVALNSHFPAMHVAFEAAKRAHVDQFFRAALSAGGKANGDPGLRAVYDPHYYAGFILDPDGHNIEAVCRKAQGAALQAQARDL
jgi:catechol 2,3-dioxygenase-like lactoylglutathione lyase family enzyme